MAVQRNSFHSSPPVCPSHQGAAPSGNKPATDRSSHHEDIHGIDGPQAGKKHHGKTHHDNKHHSAHAKNAGDIGGHHGKTHHGSKHQPPPAQSSKIKDFSSKVKQKLSTMFNKGPHSQNQTSSSPQKTPSPTAAGNTKSPAPVARGQGANNLDQAASNTHIKFSPVVRGDEASEDAKITDQASFARAVDKTAKEYGLDPNQFRAQLQKESGAMTDYKKAMHLEGDLGRRSDNNTSIGIGQISRKYLDGRDWSDGGPNNSRVGGKTVTTQMYNNSPTLQLRVAASNLAMRIQDHGGGDLKKGLNFYVSGHTQTDSGNVDYTRSINEIMQNKELMNLGR